MRGLTPRNTCSIYACQGYASHKSGNGNVSERPPSLLPYILSLSILEENPRGTLYVSIDHSINVEGLAGVGLLKVRKRIWEFLLNERGQLCIRALGAFSQKDGPAREALRSAKLWDDKAYKKSAQTHIWPSEPGKYVHDVNIKKCAMQWELWKFLLLNSIIITAQKRE